MTKRTNYGSAELSHMLEENNKPDTDQTKYIRAITEEAITQGQARRVFTFAFSLNVFQNPDISKPSTHS